MFPKKLRTDGLTEIASISSQFLQETLHQFVSQQSVMNVVWLNLKGIFLKAEVKNLIIGSRARIGHQGLPGHTSEMELSSIYFITLCYSHQ